MSQMREGHQHRAVIAETNLTRRVIILARRIEPLHRRAVAERMIEAKSVLRRQPCPLAGCGTVRASPEMTRPPASDSQSNRSAHAYFSPVGVLSATWLPVFKSPTIRKGFALTASATSRQASNYRDFALALWEVAGEHGPDVELDAQQRSGGFRTGGHARGVESLSPRRTPHFASLPRSRRPHLMPRDEAQFQRCLPPRRSAIR